MVLSLSASGGINGKKIVMNTYDAKIPREFLHGGFFIAHIR